MNRYLAPFFAVFSVFFASLANAAIDVSAATTMISTDGSAALTAIGQGLIGLAALALVYRWVKAAFF